MVSFSCFTVSQNETSILLGHLLNLVFFFTGKNLVYNSLDRTLILHAHDPTSINLVTNHSHPAWSGHVTRTDARDQFASGKHRNNIITRQITNTI